MNLYFHQFLLKFRKSESGIFFFCFQIAVVEEDGREDKATIKCETSPPPTPRAIRMTHTLPSSYHNDARRYGRPSTLHVVCPPSKNILPFSVIRLLKIYIKFFIWAIILLLPLHNITCEKAKFSFWGQIFIFRINCIFFVLILVNILRIAFPY